MRNIDVCKTDDGIMLVPRMDDSVENIRLTVETTRQKDSNSKSDLPISGCPIDNCKFDGYISKKALERISMGDEGWLEEYLREHLIMDHDTHPDIADLLTGVDKDG